MFVSALSRAPAPLTAPRTRTLRLAPQNYPTPALFTAARAAMGATRAALSAVSAAAAPEQLRSNLSVSAAAALPLVACLGAGSTVPLITSSIASFIKLYLLLLFVRVLLSWFPNVDWMGQPWLTLRQVTDPYLRCAASWRQGLVQPRAHRPRIRSAPRREAELAGRSRAKGSSGRCSALRGTRQLGPYAKAGASDPGSPCGLLERLSLACACELGRV